VAIYVAILVTFLGLLYGAYKATGSQKKTASYTPRAMSNGTSIFAPTTILLSLDGFRADFLHRDITPTLNDFILSGVSPKYMLPSFPSVTFPNHFTLVTGLYPESHGLVGNTFWDPNTSKQFHYGDASRSMQPEWWNAEPVWETAELAGIRSAIHMWPGSEAHIGSMEPMYVDKYDAKENLAKKTERILGWLDLPGSQDERAAPDGTRPQLIAAYIPDVDADGHKYGPNTTEVRTAIANVDAMLEDLFQGIEARNLTEIVNIVIVSDHGMASTDASRLIQFEDIIDPKLIQHIDGWPLYGLRPVDTSEAHLMEIYNDLQAVSQTPKYKGTFEVYLRDHNMPERYHFHKHPRIAPLWLVPTTGWAIVTKQEFDVEISQKGSIVYSPRGLHGYDHENPLMRAIFVARGPAFPHTPGSEVEVFQNTEVYNIVCDSLGLTPVPNNGTLRLPFKTVGVHSLPGPGEVPEDPLPSGATEAAIPAIVPVPVFSEMPAIEAATSIPASSVKPSVIWTTDAQGSLVTASPDSGKDAEPGNGDDSADEDKQFDQNLNNKHQGWWDWVTGNVEDAKNWVTGLVHKGDKTEPSGDPQGHD
jgi:predicted AlkP superfamily pyrophosphatase or phosphodiesterase